MRKEPTVFYILRLLIMAGLFIILCMLYWSSSLVEQDLLELKNEVSTLTSETAKMHKGILKALASTDNVKRETTTQSQKSENLWPHIDPKLPNLLAVDPFYEKTLPEMLGPNFEPEFTRYTASVGKPDNLHPFSNWSQVATWVDQCTVAVASQEFGIYETMAQDMGYKMEERKRKDSDVPEYWIFLRDDVYWEPLSPDFFPKDFKLAPHFLKRHKVTAHDFKFFYDAMMNTFVQETGAAAARTFYNELESVEVIDDLTFVARWKAQDVKLPDGTTVPRIKYRAKSLTGSLKALPSFVYKYFADGTKIIQEDNYRTNSTWAQNFSKHWASNIIVSCGPWIFDGMTERQIQFKRNPHFFNPYAALVDGMTNDFKNSPETIWQAFKENRIDTYNLQPNQFSEFDLFQKSPSYEKQKNDGLAIKQLEYVDRFYTYIGWNEARDFFKSKLVRRAMTMAIDRQRIIQDYLNGMGVEIHGPIFIRSPSSNPNITPWPYDPLAAKRLLAQEGWSDINGTGIIAKKINGTVVPFSFSLTYYVKNPTTKAICEYVSTALKEIGIECKLHGVDVADLSAIFDDKNFDALCLSWVLGTPPEDPKQLWDSSGAREKGSSNMIGFSNQEVDEIIRQLQFEYDKEKRLALYHRFEEIIHEEQPYTFLYTPKVTLLYREYLQNVFIPADRQDLIPGANVEQPQPNIYWIKPHAQLHH